MSPRPCAPTYRARTARNATSRACAPSSTTPTRGHATRRCTSPARRWWCIHRRGGCCSAGTRGCRRGCRSAVTAIRARPRRSRSPSGRRSRRPASHDLVAWPDPAAPRLVHVVIVPVPAARGEDAARARRLPLRARDRDARRDRPRGRFRALQWCTLDEAARLAAGQPAHHARRVADVLAVTPDSGEIERAVANMPTDGADRRQCRR